MEGNERITLYQPGLPETDDYGQVTYGEPVPIVCYARRQDRGGRESVYADQQLGNWSTRFEIRRFAINEELNEKWYLEDVYGIIYDIVSRTEARGSRIFWWIYAVRR